MTVLEFVLITAGAAVYFSSFLHLVANISG